jgi:hypothetical protein
VRAIEAGKVDGKRWILMAANALPDTTAYHQ